MGEMDNNQNISKEQKRPKWQIIVIILFFIIGYIVSMPCLCQAGATKGAVKSMFLLIVLGRLIFGVYKNHLKISDCVLWIGTYFILCIGIEILL
jgi:uncharacterized membrane protein (DUF106 family)